MNIEIIVYQVIDGTGRTLNVDAKAEIAYSPREGYNADKIAALERDLGSFIYTRLKAALKKEAQP